MDNDKVDTYYLYTDVFGIINSTPIKVGYQVKYDSDKYKIFTFNEVEELRKQFKIGDNGFRTLVFISAFEIKGNKIVRPEFISQRWIDQLISLGYDVSKLQYNII
jgi:hypothetical protein